MSSPPSRLFADRLTLRLDRRELYLRIHHVTMFVRDKDRSLRFYLDQLGFSLVADYRSHAKLLNWCNEAAVVHWTQESSEIPFWQEVQQHIADGGTIRELSRVSARIGT